MNGVVKGERGRLADLFDWLENEVPALPVFRPLASSQVIRVEDFIEDGRYVLRADLPGIDPDKDVEITIEEGLLQVSAERHQEKHDVQATYRGGVLEVRVGIKELQKLETKHVAIAKG